MSKTVKPNGQDAHVKTCQDCGRDYSVDEYLESSANYFTSPHNYEDGADRFCLPCWLGVKGED
jgi:hypothetical protein